MSNNYQKYYKQDEAPVETKREAAEEVVEKTAAEKMPEKKAKTPKKPEHVVPAYIINCRAVNLRREPRIDADVCAVIYEGNKLFSDGEMKDGFVRIYVGDTLDPSGWCKAEFIKF